MKKLLIVFICLILCGCRSMEMELLDEAPLATGGPVPDYPIYTIGTSRPEKIVIIVEEEIKE